MMVEIIDSTQAGFQGTSSFARHASISILQVVRAQDQLGFFGLMVGCLATAWIPLQEAHYCSIHSQQSVTLWAVWVCCQLLQVTHAIWLVRNQQVSSIEVHFSCRSPDFCLGLSFARY